MAMELFMIVYISCRLDQMKICIGTCLPCMVANEDCTCKAILIYNIHVAALKSACVVTLLGCYRGNKTLICFVFQYCDRYITFTQLRSLTDACMLANASMRVHVYKVSMGQPYTVLVIESVPYWTD